MEIQLNFSIGCFFIEVEMKNEICLTGYDPIQDEGADRENQCY